VLDLMKRWELGCYFQDKNMVVRIAGDPVSRDDSSDVSGPNLHDPGDTALRPGGPEFTGPTETLYRGSHGPDQQVLAAAEQGAQVANDFSAASALRDPDPREGPGWQRNFIVSNTLAVLSGLVFPSPHFEYSWIGYSGQEYNQMRVNYTGGGRVCVLRAGYVNNAYGCSFQFHGELDQQFNTIRCMAYNLCCSFITRGRTEVLDRMHSLSRYLWVTWGSHECGGVMHHLEPPSAPASSSFACAWA
jgi:hypothetical protein